jgi:hypothetical protein
MCPKWHSLPAFCISGGHMGCKVLKLPKKPLIWDCEQCGLPCILLNILDALLYCDECAAITLRAKAFDDFDEE